MILSSLFTNTKKLLSKLFRTKTSFDNKYKDMGRQFALDYLEDLRRAIQSQDFPNTYPALIEEWVARKETAHKNDMFINKGDLLSEIMGIVPEIQESTPFYTTYVIKFPSAGKVKGLNIRPLFTDIYDQQRDKMKIYGKFYVQDIIDREWNSK